MNNSNATWATGATGKLLREFKFALTALTIGSRMVPLGDNRQLFQELAAKANLLYR